MFGSLQAGFPIGSPHPDGCFHNESNTVQTEKKNCFRFIFKVPLVQLRQPQPLGLLDTDLRPLRLRLPEVPQLASGAKCSGVERST